MFFPFWSYKVYIYEICDLYASLFSIDLVIHILVCCDKGSYNTYNRIGLNRAPLLNTTQNIENEIEPQSKTKIQTIEPPL